MTEYYGTDPVKVAEDPQRGSGYRDRLLDAIYPPRDLGGADVTTRRLIEDIPAEEEEHADDIIDLLGSDAGS